MADSKDSKESLKTSPDRRDMDDAATRERRGSKFVAPEEVSPNAARWASMFGGAKTVVGPRIAPPIGSLADEAPSSDENNELANAEDVLNKQLSSEAGASIQYRTCSWQKTASLLFSEYICLAIMSFPWSYSLLGLVPGLILTVVVALIVLYTSLVLWQFCLRHPEVRDVCDIGQMLFWGKKWAWWGTAAMFVLNNTFIEALHVVVGAEYLNTMTAADHIGGCRTVAFAAVITVLCWLGSLPRTFDMLSKLATVSAFFTFVSVVLAAIFAGIQGNPVGYTEEKGAPLVHAGPPPGTSFVLGMSAFLNISYTFIGQITLPSFIAEMRDPREFPKALWACTIAEILVFGIVGAIIYAYSGTQYVTSPAFGNLHDLYKKVSFSFMIPTLLFLGCLYASVTARFVFFRLFRGTRHMSEHTVVGWASWSGILLATWILAFFISQVIPFFNSLLAVMSSLFDCWFGFIFWGVAYFRMRGADKRTGKKQNPVLDMISMALNVAIILVGVFFLTVGTYASVQGIIDSYAAGEVAGVFSCASNAI